MADTRTTRLAELVAELTGCAPGGALHAVKEHDGAPDALEVVARAMVLVDQPPPAELRPTGYVRRDGIGLAHHGSLRRWERTVHPPDTILLED
jgi:hypothetical protein